jgi:hypothetical protein
MENVGKEIQTQNEAAGHTEWTEKLIKEGRRKG